MSLTPDFLEKFPSMARMANRLDSSSFLDSRSSSPEDSETSGFSSGSDHLCDMLVRTDLRLGLCLGVYGTGCLIIQKLQRQRCAFSLQSTLRISPPLPYLASNMQKDLLRLSSRLDPQDSSSPLTPPSSASSASSALSRRWRAGSPWPGADVLDQSDETFSIEREARLHRQAAGMRIVSKRNHWAFWICLTPQLWTKPPSPGVVSCLPGTTRILCIPARSFLGAFPGTSRKVTLTSGSLLSFLPLRVGLAGSALDVGASFPASVKLQSRWYLYVLIFKFSSGKNFVQACLGTSRAANETLVRMWSW